MVHIGIGSIIVSLVLIFIAIERVGVDAFLDKFIIILAAVFLANGLLRAVSRAMDGA